VLGRCYAKYGKLNPKRYICKELAETYYKAVYSGGCLTFKSSSKRHCKC
jgi:hypothetical protein